jgi:predicted transcriptional regulator
MNIKQISKALNARKSDWSDLAVKAKISRKTIERIAALKTDPRLSIVERLTKLLEQ